MEITTVRYTVETNDQVEITFDDASTYTQPYNEIRYRYTDQLNDWLEGKTQAWIADEAAYNDYRAIMDYDPESGEPEPPGYNSPEAVTESEQAHIDWTQAKLNWESDPENTGPYPVAEPVVLLAPADLPVVPAPTPPEAELVPNIIDPYDAYYGVTDEQLRNQAYSANSTYCDTVILAAEANPVQGTNLDSKGTAKENDKRVNRAKGKNKLTDNDDFLADHIDECYDTLDNSDDIVETLTRQQLIDWDPATIVFPVWSAPT